MSSVESCRNPMKIKLLERNLQNCFRLQLTFALIIVQSPLLAVGPVYCLPIDPVHPHRLNCPELTPIGCCAFSVRCSCHLLSNQTIQFLNGGDGEICTRVLIASTLPHICHYQTHNSIYCNLTN